MIGGRLGKELIYPVDDTALKHDAGVTEETPEGKVAYARFPAGGGRAYRDGDLPR